MSEPTNETKIVCPHCGQHILIEASMLGTELQCPACNQSFTAPEADTDESETSVAEPPVRDAGGEETSTRTGIKTSLRAAWIKWMRPAVCFVLASLWFVSRSVVRLVVKAVRFPVRVIFTPAKNLFSRLAGSGFLQRHAKLRRVGIVVRDTIRSFGSRFVVRPGRWIGVHVLRPVDECWCRYEAARASAGDDGGIGACGNPNPSLKRRIAYVATALVAIAVLVCTGREQSDSGSGTTTSYRSRPSYAGSSSSTTERDKATKPKNKRRSSASPESLCREFIDGGNSYQGNGRRGQFWTSWGTPFEQVDKTTVRWNSGGETPPSICEVVFLRNGIARVTEDNTFFAREFRGNTLSEVADALKRAFGSMNSELEGLVDVSTTVTDDGHILFSAEIEVSPGSVSDSVGNTLFGMAKSRTLLRM